MTNNLIFKREDVRAYFKESYALTNTEIEEIQNRANTEEAKQELKKIGFIVNPYEKKAGNLSFAERKVNLESIENSFNKIEAKLLEEVAELARKEKQKLVREIKKALEAKDYQKLQSLQVNFKGDLAKKYAAVMKELFEIGKKTAADEMTVKIPATSRDVSGLYRAQALELEEKIASDMAGVAKEEALANASKGATVVATVDQVEKAIDQKINKVINASATQALNGAFSAWRVTTYEANIDKIYAFQYTAVLDRRTTNLCQSLNGRVIEKGDPDFYRLQPPNHYRCRSFWVGILVDEFLKPKISKIPASIPRNTSYTTFQDLKELKPYTPSVNDRAITEEKKAQVVSDTVKELQKAWLDLK